MMATAFFDHANITAGDLHLKYFEPCYRSVVMSVALCVSNAGLATTMTGGTAVSLNIDQPTHTIFVSYPGRLWDQCGLQLVELSEFGSVTPALAQRLVVKAGEDVLIPIVRPNTIGYDFSYKVLPMQLYGLFITIATVNGENLSALSSEKSELLVITTPCPG